MFEAGDFIKNKRFEYISFVYSIFESRPYAIIIDATDAVQKMSLDFIREGILRLEWKDELEKVEPTLQLIAKAREYIGKSNNSNVQLVDNLSTIELLAKLREKEKGLTNETQL